MLWCGGTDRSAVFLFAQTYRQRQSGGTWHDYHYAPSVLFGYVRKGRSAAGSHCKTLHPVEIYST